MTWPAKIYCATTVLGVYYTSNFSDPGTQPNWTAVNTGLANTAVRQFAVDPTDPENKQYCLLASPRDLYYREDEGDWVSILASADAATTLGLTGGGTIGAFYVDPSTTGRIWVCVFGTVTSPYASRAYAMYTDDYGANWSAATRVVTSGVVNTTGAPMIWGCGDNVWVWLSRDVGQRCYASSDEGVTWSAAASLNNSNSGSGFNPLQDTVAYFGLTNIKTVSNAGSIVTLDAAFGGPAGRANDTMWFSSSDADHHRCISSAKVYATTDSWDTVNTPSAISPAPICFAVWAGADEDQMIVGVSLSAQDHVIGVLYGEADVTVTGIAGTNCGTSPYTNAIPETCGTVALGGIAPVKDAATPGAVTAVVATAAAAAIPPVVKGSKNYAQAASGALTPTGTVTYTRGFIESLVGALTPTGALQKSTTKPLVGALTPTGTLLKSILRTLVGDLTPTGDLIAGRGYSQSLDGELVPEYWDMFYSRGYNRYFSGRFLGLGKQPIWWLAGGVAGARCIAAYQPLDAADLAASYINLANPGTYNAAPGVAPAWDAVNGWKFDGSTMYLETGIVPAYDQTWSMIVRYSEHVYSADTALAGCYDAGVGDFLLNPRDSALFAYSGGTSNQAGSNAPEMVTGIFGLGGTIIYRNGIAEAVSIPVDVGTNSNSISLVIGANNYSNTTIADFMNGNIQAIAIYDCILSPEQFLAISEAMFALEPVTIPIWYLPTGLSSTRCIAAYQPIDAPSLAASYVNLANPGTYDAVPVVAPTFNPATGWVFDAMDSYLDSGITPVLDQTWSVVVRFSRFASGYLFGLSDGSAGFYVGSHPVWGTTLSYHGDSYVENAPVLPRYGTYAMAGLIPYRNGIAEPSQIGAAPTTTAYTIYIGACSIFLGPFFLRGDIAAIAFYDCVLTPEQVLEIHDAMSALPKPVWGATDIGTLLKNASKTFAGGVTHAGTLIKSGIKALIGALTPTGTLLKNTARTLVGSLTPTGALAYAIGYFKSLLGALTPTGSLLKNAAKTLVGSLTPTGALAYTRSFIKSLVGSLTPTGTLLKNTARTLVGSLTPTGALAYAKSFFKSLVGSLTSTGSLLKRTAKPLVGTSTPTGTLLKATAKPLAGANTPTGALAYARAFLKALVGSLTPTGAVAYTRGFSKVLAGALTSTGTLIRRTTKLLAGALVSTGALAVGSHFLATLAGTMTFVGILVRNTNKSFAGALNSLGTDMTNRGFYRLLVGALLPTGALSRNTRKLFGGVLPFIGTLTKRTGKLLAGVLSFLGNLSVFPKPKPVCLSQSDAPANVSIITAVPVNVLVVSAIAAPALYIADAPISQVTVSNAALYVMVVSEDLCNI